MVDHNNTNRITALFSIEHTPARACTPGAVAGLAGGGQVVAVDIGGIAGSHFGLITIDVVEFARSAGGDLQFFANAQAEHPVFGIREMDIGLGGEGCNAVDDSFLCSSGEAIGRMFDKQRRILLVCPSGSVDKYGLARVVRSGAYRVRSDPTVFVFLVRGDSVRIVPEVETVDVFIIEPKPDMMGMVGGIAGARLERKAAGDDLAIGGIDGIENRFFKGIRVEKGRERDGAGGDDDASMGWVGGDLNGDGLRGRLRGLGGRLRGRDQEEEENHGPDREDRGMNNMAYSGHMTAFAGKL
jgi:hypothetical protein